MVRTYKRKTERASVPLAAYDAAINDVDGGKTIRQAAKDHGLCHVSLQRRLKKRENGGDNYNSTFSKHKKVFDGEQERELANYIHCCSERHFGLSSVEARKLAYQCAKKFTIPTPPSWDREQIAGEDWFLSFRKRHQFSLRKAENTSLGRAIGFNRPAVQLFYDNLAQAMSRHSYGAHQIYNVDETGVSTVPSSARVVAKTGSRSVGRIVSAERGTLVTLVCAINAIGNSIPPMFIFPRKHFKDHFLIGAPPGSKGVANGSGWIKEENWLEYIQHFIKYSKPSAESMKKYKWSQIERESR
ncbi:hypothetical protein EGW08_008645 [Elysia chlorotica]|uniref:HTH CENPB-type domain-containing protein n=1 Tax=Elysia chlorotica TaxID=188477 RepID=A0A3S0ZP36_ELYCH|nr:hypothetical protein EGW08_008645 [Elysia chlorotica]